MPLTPDQERLLAALHRNLRQYPIKHDHPFYVNLREERFEYAFGEDVVSQLARDVSWELAPWVAFFSGFRGAGKSTELNRLRYALGEEGFAVAMFDVEDYLDLRYPITAGQLVFAMAGGIWQSCVDQGWVDKNDEGGSPFRRLWEWVKTVRVDGEVRLSVPLPDWSPIDFEAHLHRDPTFREELGEFLRSQSVELKARAEEFFEELDNQVRRHFERNGREWLGMVVIVDSLDHARSEVQFAEVRNAIREVFDLQLPQVKFDRFRTVFCVPPYISPRGGTVRRMFNVKVADRGGTGFRPGVQSLVEMLEHRFPEGLAAGELLSQPQLEKLIDQSGGHIRDLLRLVDEVILGVETMPASDRDVDAAVVRVRETFLPLTNVDKRWLGEIAATHELELDDEEAWQGLAKLLDRHMVLRYSNDEPWYDVHPIIADHVGSKARTRAGDPPST